MDEKTVASFYQLINNLIDAKLSKVDHLEICQIVSDDNGSGKYNIKLLSGENTIVHDVVTSRKASFKNGDYVYILKIHNRLSNSIIIGGNVPHIKQTVQATEEEIIKYRIYFTLGDYVNFGYLSTNPNAERGDPSGTEYDPGTIVYYFVEKYADDVSYRYECSGTQINGDIYRLGSVSIRDQDIILSNISGVTRYNAGQYAITTTIVNGTVGSSSATTIQEGMTATVYISPDAHYDMPYQADFTVTGCTISSFNRSTGALVIAKASGNTDPVTISVTCISTETYDLSFTLGSHIRWVVWTLNGVEQENISSSVTFSNALTYGDSLSWYAVPNNHYETEHDVNNPVVVSKVTGNLSYNVSSTIEQYPVTFTLGNYVTRAFTSTSDSATTGNSSGYEYDYGTRVYYFVEKYANTSQYTYTCSGTQVSGNVYRLGYIDLNDHNGNLGSLSSVTRTENPILSDPVIELTWSNYHSTILVKVTNPSSSPAAANMYYDYSYETQTEDISDSSQFASSVSPGGYATFYINQSGSSGTVEVGTLTITFDGVAVQSSSKTISLTPNNITTTVSHGHVVSNMSATRIWPQDSALVYVQADTGYEMPETISVSGATFTWDSEYSTDIGEIELFNATSDIIISVTCQLIPVATYSLTFNRGVGVNSYLYSLYTYDDYQGPFNTTQIINDIPSGSNYYYYCIPTTGYVVNYTQSNPYVGQITDHNVTENLGGIAVYTYTAGIKTGVASLKMYRVSSFYNNATLGLVDDNDSIYDGDEIFFVPTAVSGYTVSTLYYDSTHTLTVSGNVVGTDYISVVENTLDAPTVQLVWSQYRDEVNIVVTNPATNPSVTLSYYCVYETSTESYDDADTVGTVAAGGSDTINITAPAEIIQGYIDVTISATGYTSTTVTKNFDE